VKRTLTPFLELSPILHSLTLGVIVGQVSVVEGTPLPRRQASSDAAAALHQGSVKGFKDSHGNSVFLGIPFAETTGGQNRYVS